MTWTFVGNGFVPDAIETFSAAGKLSLELQPNLGRNSVEQRLKVPAAGKFFSLCVAVHIPPFTPPPLLGDLPRVNACQCCNYTLCLQDDFKFWCEPNLPVHAVCERLKAAQSSVRNSAHPVLQLKAQNFLETLLHCSDPDQHVVTLLCLLLTHIGHDRRPLMHEPNVEKCKSIVRKGACDSPHLFLAVKH